MNENSVATPARRVRRTRAEWQQIIGEYENANLTQKEFCVENNLGSVSFSKWYHRLRQNQDTGFVALVAPDALPSKQTPIAMEKTSGFEVRLELGDGLVLHLSRA